MAVATSSPTAANHSVPASPLVQLVYASRANQEFSVPQLSELLSDARARNTRVGVTGLLLYHERSFLQLLEGAAESVDATFRRIEQDPRHCDVHVLLRGRVFAREFEGWSMGFVAPETLASSLDGYIDYTEELCLHLLDSTRGKRLLKLFREGSLRDRVEAWQRL
jgi:hypothetical protein